MAEPPSLPRTDVSRGETARVFRAKTICEIGFRNRTLASLSFRLLLLRLSVLIASYKYLVRGVQSNWVFMTRLMACRGRVSLNAIRCSLSYPSLPLPLSLSLSLPLSLSLSLSLHTALSFFAKAVAVLLGLMMMKMRRRIDRLLFVAVTSALSPSPSPSPSFTLASFDFRGRKRDFFPQRGNAEGCCAFPFLSQAPSLVIFTLIFRVAR